MCWKWLRRNKKLEPVLEIRVPHPAEFLKQLAVVRVEHRTVGTTSVYGDYGIVIGDKIYLSDTTLDLKKLDEWLSFNGPEETQSILEIYEPIEDLNQFVHANWKVDSRYKTNKVDVKLLESVWTRYKQEEIQ